MYWFCTITISTLSIICFAVNVANNRPTDACSDAGVINGDLWWRLITGCAQLPVHVLGLMPARLSAARAAKVTQDLWKGNKGGFYRAVSICNVALVFVVGWSAYALSAYKTCMEQLKGFSDVPQFLFYAVRTHRSNASHAPIQSCLLGVSSVLRSWQRWPFGRRCWWRG